ncbi:MAG: sodium:calcium antiporter [Deltaproteobacteria bacterium]|nr:sodium:calcium antiporter [Deltaproteobacteria bacterium]
MVMWSHFFISALIIFFAGSYLSDLADETAGLTGLSKGFIGALILGIITSLPELIGTLFAVIYKANPDLGVGNVFGSNLFNIAILSLAILMFSHRISYNDWVWRSNFSVYMSICLSAFMIMLIGIYHTEASIPANWSNIGILGFYILGMWIYSFENGETKISKIANRKSIHHSLRLNLILIAIFGSMVVGAGVLLADACNEIAHHTHMTSTFVGTLFMAAATSLPELVVTMRLLRMGNIGMATGNIFGSNLINLTIVAIVDLIYKGNVYATITDIQLVTVATGIIMSGIFLLGTLIKRSRRLTIHIDNVSILIIYVLIYLWLYGH